tara:strand:+ start:9294 stop:11534 length:2241 start_codon:yes stop_codon:yes gene_type:complete
MKEKEKKKSTIGFIRAFFPFQLIVYQLKYNLFSIFFWVALFLIIGDRLGYSFGIPLLFLSPEYLGEVSFTSFLLLGIAVGGFIMGFNTFSYMRLGQHFPFLTTVSRPFFKFCINNATVPLLFIIYYIIQMAHFQNHEELESVGHIISYSFAFAIGISLFSALSFLFFFRANANKIISSNQETSSKPISSMLHKKEKWYNHFKKDKDRTSIYIGKSFRIKQSRSLKHFDQQLIENVFAKNRINSSIYEIATITIFLILGAFNDYDIFIVPASVSIVLLLTIFQMLFSALHSWFRAWVYPLILIVIFSMDYISQNSSYFHYMNTAYGLNYTQRNRDEYNIGRLQEITEDRTLSKKSLISYLQTLENWKKNTGEDKPKLVIINSSGGGSRSALWSLTVLLNSNQELNGELSNKIQLITGASGGMVGSAYYRELVLRTQTNTFSNLYASEFKNNMGKDMLNRLSFMASTNDLFVRYQTFKYNQQSYTKDRGYAFEEQLLKNTNNVLNHSLGYYKDLEKQGTIPTMIFAPTIVNDGRRLLISSQSLNFLAIPAVDRKNYPSAFENIDFHSLLAKQNTDSIRFSTVLRMSATFPFVMPMVTLPTEPEIQVMDAGIRDNYGGKVSSEYIFALQDWIRENTSGVIIIQIRDTKNILEHESYRQISFIDKLSLPFGNMYKNFPRVQDFNQEELLKIGFQFNDFPIDIVTFNLRERKNDRISLSWHLTKQEKNKIESAYYSKGNRLAFEKLKELLQ